VSAPPSAQKPGPAGPPQAKPFVWGPSTGAIRLPSAEGVQELLQALGRCFPTYAAQAWEKIKGAALRLEQARFNLWAKQFLPIGKEDDGAHWRRVKELPGYHQEWIIGMFEPHVLAFAEKKKGHTIGNAAFGTTGGEIGHAMRPSKMGRGACVHVNDLFRLMQLLASPSTDAYWDNESKNIMYVFEPDPRTPIRLGEKMGDKRGKIAISVHVEGNTIEKNGKRVKRRVNRMVTMGFVGQKHLDQNSKRYEKIQKTKLP